LAFIDVRDLGKAFPVKGGVRQVLRAVSLSVDRGQFVSVLGAMGTGKSTLLGILAGLTAPTEGTVTIDGEPVRGIRRDAAVVFQNYSLLPWFTAIENVRLAVGAALPDLNRDEQRAHAQRALEQVGLGSALHRRPSQLSGGMRQRVAIARAFATRPEVLFLDEPFGALDAMTRETLQHDLAQLCSSSERPVTVVMITNNVEEALLLSDLIVPIVAGPPATLGPPIPVALPRPRTTAHLASDEVTSHVRAHVVATLTSALGSRRRHRHAEAAAQAAESAAQANHLRQGYGGPPKLYAKAEVCALHPACSTGALAPVEE
jgi:ABC-type nitrate/sulfonate/bicarbonate transport system ATPase subunit